VDKTRPRRYFGALPNDANGRRIRAAHAALLLSLLAVVAGLALEPLSESDVFFRVRCGLEILARRALPASNLYSFTYPDHPDLDTAWLFEVGAALLFRRGGFPALVLAKTALLVATFAGAFVVCRRRGAGPVASAVALAAAAFAIRERFVERPHLFSLAGEVALLALVDALATTRDAARARRWGAATLATVIVWANLHAGVFLAPVLLALAAVGAWLDERRAPRGLAAAPLAILAGAAALATLATPVGFGLYRYLGLHLALPALHPVDEFRAATWISDAPLLIFGGAAVAAGALVRPRAARVLLPAAALGVLGLRSIRFGADFALVAAPILAVGLHRLGARRGPNLGGTRPAVAVAAALALGAVAPRVAAARAGRPAFALGLDESVVPLDAIRFATEHGLRARMYNDFEIGSYLLFEGPPRYQVFVDPRLPAYPPEFHALLGRADLTRAEWDVAMERYGVDAALLAYAGLNRRVAWWDPTRWALVYRAHDARVFVRRSPAHRALIAERELPATFSFTENEGTTTVPLPAPPPESPVPACEWQRRLGDMLFELDGGASPRARAAYEGALAPVGCLEAAREAKLCAWLGALELEARHFDAADRLLTRALDHGDAELTTRANRAFAWEGLGRRLDAAAAWADVEARGRGTPLADVAAKRRAARSSK
jgi:hypothetical protein